MNMNNIQIYIKQMIYEYLSDSVPTYIQSLLDPELIANEDPVLVQQTMNVLIAGRDRSFK